MKNICKKLLLLATFACVSSLANAAMTPLHIAARDGNTPVVQALLAAPEILVNTQNILGWTPLHLAAMEGHTAVVQLLLAAPGILVNTQDNAGWTPLHWASECGRLAVVQALLDTDGIDAAIENNEHQTARQLFENYMAAHAEDDGYDPNLFADVLDIFPVPNDDDAVMEI